MQGEVVPRDLLRRELGRHDWSVLHSYTGEAKLLPGAIEALVYADSDEKAKLAWRTITAVATAQGRLSESATALTSCLVVGLPVATEVAREYILELLATIAGGLDDHVDSAHVGPVSVAECVRLMKPLIPALEEEVTLHCNGTSVDILLMCGLYDPKLIAHIVEIFEAALKNSRCVQIADLVESSLEELKAAD